MINQTFLFYGKKETKWNSKYFYCLVQNTKVVSVFNRPIFIVQAPNSTQYVALFSARPYSNASLTIARAHPFYESLTICWLGVTRVGGCDREEQKEWKRGRERENIEQSLFFIASLRP